MANSPFIAPPGGPFPETEAQRLYRENQHIQWQQDEDARIKRDYIKAHGGAKWNESQAKLIKDAEGRNAYQAQRDKEKRIKDTKDILRSSAIELIYISPISSQTSRGYKDSLQHGREMERAQGGVSVKQLAVALLNMMIQDQEDIESGRRRIVLAAFGGEAVAKQAAKMVEMGKDLQANGGNIGNAFTQYSGALVRLKELEERFPSVVDADPEVRAGLVAWNNPPYKINYTDGTIIKNDRYVSPESAAVTAAIGGGLPGAEFGGLGALNAAQLADLKNVLAKEQGEKNKVADRLKERSEREKKAAADLAKAVQAQQDKRRGPIGGTPVAPLVRKPPPVKTPVKPAKPPKYTGKKK